MQLSIFLTLLGCTIVGLSVFVLFLGSYGVWFTLNPWQLRWVECKLLLWTPSSSESRATELAGDLAVIGLLFLFLTSFLVDNMIVEAPLTGEKAFFFKFFFIVFPKYWIHYMREYNAPLVTIKNGPPEPKHNDRKDPASLPSPWAKCLNVANAAERWEGLLVDVWQDVFHPQHWHTIYLESQERFLRGCMT